MMPNESQKITAGHRGRKAFLYVRQSTIRQVVENQESTRRQYEMRRKAELLGWPVGDIQVIDCDLGMSGASSVDRAGFQKLVAEVGMGHAGIVMGLEVSRLARCNSDWHRLIELCALTATLILDEEGLYDPALFNDRLLLGLKGAMSEAELHVIRSRLQGGLLNKAKRGELWMRPPTGFVYDQNQRVVLDPDLQVQNTIRLLFKTFRLAGSGLETVRRFRAENVLFPTRLHCGSNKGTLTWEPLTTVRLYGVLRNPRYTGAFVYGRRHQRMLADGGIACAFVPQDGWRTLIPDANVGYISWAQYEENLKQLESNDIHRATSQTPPREGHALLQGIAICGLCGCQMRVRYYKERNGLLRTEYVCSGREANLAGMICQRVPGMQVDKSIGEMVLEIVSPAAIEVTLAVQRELEERSGEIDRVRRLRVERATYEADVARRRFELVEPENRLVAVSLENEWNGKLKALAEATDEYERLGRAERLHLDQEAQAKIKALCYDFPQVWRNPKTPARERKRLLRLIVEDVTLTRTGDIKINVRFRGGAAKSISIPAPTANWDEWKTSDEIVQKIDQLINDHTHGEIAARLNADSQTTGKGGVFTSRKVRHIQRGYGLKSRYLRLREAGMITQREIARKLGISKRHVGDMKRFGILPVKVCKLNDGGECMYGDPSENELKMFREKAIRIYADGRSRMLLSTGTQEV